MYAYIIRRILATIPVMAVVAIFVFLLLYLTPGDPAVVIAGDYARPADIERIREALGLNRPLYVQFFIWVGNVFSGDLGVSIFSNLPVAKLIGQRLEPTLMLSLATTIFAVIVAVPMGVLAAWKAHTWVDRLIMVFAVLGFSVPVFVIAYILMWIFSLNLGWFPVQGYKPIGDGIGPFLASIALPTLALGLVYVALIARMTRASVMEVLTEDYIRTARRQGCQQPHPLDEARAEKCLRAHRHDHRCRRCPADWRRRRDRECVQHSGPGSLDHRCRFAARLPDHPRRHPGLQRHLCAGEPAD